MRTLDNLVEVVRRNQSFHRNGVPVRIYRSFAVFVLASVLSLASVTARPDDVGPTIEQTIAYVNQHIDEKVDLYGSTLISTNERGRQTAIELTDTSGFNLDASVPGSLIVLAQCITGAYCGEMHDGTKWHYEGRFVTANDRQYQQRVSNALNHLLDLVKKKNAAPPDPFEKTPK